VSDHLLNHPQVQILALVAITVIRFYRNLLDRSGKGFPVKFETIGVSRKLRGVRKTDFESERRDNCALRPRKRRPLKFGHQRRGLKRQRTSNDDLLETIEEKLGKVFYFP